MAVVRRALAVDVSAPVAPVARRSRLVRELLVAYALSWLVGYGYGFILRSGPNWHAGSAWERALLQWFHDRPLTSWLDAIVILIPFTGTNLTLLPVCLVAAWWFWKRRQRPLIGLQLLTVTVGSLSINAAMKHALGRERPELFPQRGMFDWASYPSGHAIVTPALYFTVAMMLYRERGWRWPFVVATIVLILNMHSRLYLSVHWPTDLIGGLLIGFVWLFGTWRAFARYAESEARDSSPHSRAR